MCSFCLVASFYLLCLYCESMYEYVRRVWSAEFVNRLLLSYFLLINFVNLFHPQFNSQFGLSDFP